MAKPKPPTLDSEWTSWRDDVTARRHVLPDDDLILFLMEESFYAGATAALLLHGPHKVPVHSIASQVMAAIARFTGRLKERADEPKH